MKKGFTLVEVVILIVIVTLLLMVSLPNYHKTSEVSESNDVIPSRMFVGPNQYPPETFAAYGILAFPQRATPSSRERHLMICHAYTAALPHFTDLKEVPLNHQMVTVWPIEDESHATIIDLDTKRADVCEPAVDYYGLVAAKRALRSAKLAQNANAERIVGDSIDFNDLTKGPYLLAWAPGESIKDPDALVLVVDLSLVSLPEHAEEVFSRWVRQIEQDPSLWQDGWDESALILKIRMWTDEMGVLVPGWLFNAK